LAVQHHRTIQHLLEPLGVRVALVTGSQKPKKGEEMPHILVGTHALLHDTKHFDRLAFVVIDEQHRFGVEQRGTLLSKGSLETYPHTLTMTATPIPRTVALTMYGNLALTHLHERPKGRIPIKTWVVTDEKREGAYEWIEKEIETENAQVFIICPFIEESENMTTVKSALKEYETIVAKYPKKRVALLHGKMKAKEKDEVMAAFRNREYDILVATPVVEVGVDIPGATIILIEGAERFGLAQLHQLRGRVGRNDQQSYCLLFTSDGTRGNERLRSMETIDNGAELAELDLKLRGPGEITGTRQSGVPSLKIASFSDFELIEQTRTAAEKYLKEDPKLTQAPLLKTKIEATLTQVIEPN
jgi:ATP-dependent DNA helicase RecG